jgi:hypothetical protein
MENDAPVVGPDAITADFTEAQLPLEEAPHPRNTNPSH